MQHQRKLCQLQMIGSAIWRNQDSSAVFHALNEIQGVCAWAEGIACKLVSVQAVCDTT